MQRSKPIRSQAKMFRFLSNPILECLRRQAMNSGLQSRYCLREASSEIKQMWRNDPYHLPGARPWGWHITFVSACSCQRAGIAWTWSLRELPFIWYSVVSEYGTRLFYGGGHARIVTHALSCRNSWNRRYSPFGAPRAPNNILSPESGKDQGGDDFPEA